MVFKVHLKQVGLFALVKANIGYLMQLIKLTNVQMTTQSLDLTPFLWFNVSDNNVASDNIF